MTQDNADELPQLLDLMDEERVDKFYFSHLNYAGRGNKNRKDDVFLNTTRWAMELLFERALADVRGGRKTELSPVTMMPSGVIDPAALDTQALPDAG